MNPILAIVVALTTLTLPAKAAFFGDGHIRDVIAAALPSSNIVGGDDGWSGGLRSNAQLHNTFIDANSIYLIIEGKPGVATQSAKDIAEGIRSHFIKKFAFPTDSPSGMWTKQQPAMTDENSFWEVILQTFPHNNDKDKSMIYITIQVIRIDDKHFGVTVSYVDIGK